MEICTTRAYRRQELIEEHFGTKNLHDGVEKAMKELTAPFLEE